MLNRLLWQCILIFSVICLTGNNSYLSAQENTTSIPGDLTCPASQFIAPVLVTSLIQVDSISLIIRYPQQSITFLSYRKVHPSIRNNGFHSIIQSGDSVIIKWGSPIAIDVINDTLVELIFRVGYQEGSITFDETGSYYENASGEEITSTYSPAQITLHPAVSVVIEEVNATCPGECDANVAAYVTGGLPPYQYLWNGNVSPLNNVLRGACSGDLPISITDANGCVFDTSFVVTELESAEIEVETTPDTVYMQNPKVRFSFTEDQSIQSWLWDFGDETERSMERNPEHLYYSAAAEGLEEYAVSLLVTFESGCTTNVTTTLPISEIDLFRPNVFTPDGDGINDVFKIAKNVGSLKEPITVEYIKMELIVFDRWGRKVYDNDNYHNDWNGGNLPEGTYFYRLNTFGLFKNESFKGSVTILRR